MQVRTVTQILKVIEFDETFKSELSRLASLFSPTVEPDESIENFSVSKEMGCDYGKESMASHIPRLVGL